MSQSPPTVVAAPPVVVIQANVYSYMRHSAAGDSHTRVAQRAAEEIRANIQEIAGLEEENHADLQKVAGRQDRIMELQARNTELETHRSERVQAASDERAVAAGYALVATTFGGQLPPLPENGEWPAGWDAVPELPRRPLGNASGSGAAEKADA